MTPLRVRVEDLDGQGGEAYAFHRSPVRVGRGALNDLRLDRPYVSTWHGLIQFDEDGICFVDLGSTNGTTVDGVRLERNSPAVIGPAHELVIGRLRLILARGATEGRTAPAEPPTRFALKMSGEAAAAESAAIAAEAALGTENAASGASSLQRTAPAEPIPAPSARPAAASDEGVERALEAASWQLGVLHDACQQANDNFRTALDQALAPLTEEQRQRARAAAAARYPQACVAGPLAAAAAPPAVGGAELRDDALRLVLAFAEAYLPADALPTTPAALETFLGALAEALETAARGYLELRNGYEQFGREMGLRVPKGEGVMARITDVRQLIGWVLQPGDPEPRPRQLAGAFADLMIHQVALLNGVQAGARSLLDELSPEALARSAERGSGLGLKALREAGLWRTFVERHQELVAEESAITAVLFGGAFARAYSAVTGRRGPGDPTPDPASTPGRR